MRVIKNKEWLAPSSRDFPTSRHQHTHTQPTPPPTTVEKLSSSIKNHMRESRGENNRMTKKQRPTQGRDRIDSTLGKKEGLQKEGSEP